MIEKIINDVIARLDGKISSDDIIKVKDEKIESLEKNLEISQHNISCIKARYLKLKEQLNNTTNEIKNLKILNEQAQNEIKFMNEKELKLMQFI